MGSLIRWVVPLIGYFCVATVVTAALGYGYMRKSGKLDDETVFRVMALVHGVDLEAIEKADAKGAASEVPGEEPSFAERQYQLQFATLHFDSKQKQLADSLSDFEYQLKRLSEATSRYGGLKHEVESYLKSQNEMIVESSRTKVREQLQAMDPKKQAKPLLIKMIDDDQVDEVILLLSGMKDRNVREILRKFDTPEDLDKLARIHEKMLAGHPTKPFIDAKIQELQQLKEQEK